MRYKQYLKVSQSNCGAIHRDKDEAIVQGPIYSPFKTPFFMKKILMFGFLLGAFACMEFSVIKADAQPSHQFEYVMPSMVIENNDLVMDEVVIYDETYTYGVISFETESMPAPVSNSRGPPALSRRLRK